MPHEAAKRVRMGADERRALLITEAMDVFASQGYTNVGLAQIAEQSEVSKTLLYHYFPGGRPEIYREVMAGLAGDLVTGIRAAVRAPLSAERRVAGAIEAFFEFLGENPAAYRLLFLEPWGTGESELIGQAMSVRIQIGSELAMALAGAGAPVGSTMAATAASVGSLLHIAEIWLAGELSDEAARKLATGYVIGGLSSTGLLARPTT